MREGFDIHRQIKKVREKKPDMDALVKSLEKYGAAVEFDEDSRDAAALHYRAIFLFPEDVIVTVGIILMDYQTDSDVVIETMTTLPGRKTRKGFGSRAISSILQWAAGVSIKDVRATQVMGEANENFWRKNGFIQQDIPNPCNDFIYSFPKRIP